MWGFGRKDARWEQGCLERARRGDGAALSELYEAFAARLYREVLLPRLGNNAAAEDALSETFRVLLEKVDSIELKGGGLWAWLATVATNKANDMHRVRHRTGRALASFEELLAPLGVDSRGGEEEIEAKQEHARVKSAVERTLAEIKPRYRRAIEFRFFEEKTRESSAQALEISVGAFDVLLCRALKSFRKEWARIHAIEGERVAT